MDDNTRGGATTQEAPDFLTPKDLQRELQIGERLCYKLLKEGSIPSVRVGGLYRTPRRDLEAALGANPGKPRLRDPRLRR